MKILIFTVGDNYHVPIIVRQILQKLTDDDIEIVISGKKTNRNLRYLLTRYGILYILSKLFERFLYLRMVRKERKLKVGYYERENITLAEVMEKYKKPLIKIEDINNNQYVKEINEKKPDVILSIYFDQILRKKILKVPIHFPLNLHPSLLPEYAGSSPTFWVLANGEKMTGITIHRMTARLDAGKIVYQKRVPILDDDSQFSLYRRSSILAINPLIACIEKYRAGEKFQSYSMGNNVKFKKCPRRITNRSTLRFYLLGRRFI